MYEMNVYDVLRLEPPHIYLYFAGKVGNGCNSLL